MTTSMSREDAEALTADIRQALDDYADAYQQATSLTQALVGVYPVPDHRTPGTRVHDGYSPWFDLAGMLRDGIPDPPHPEVGLREDGNALFYRGQVNGLFGDPESGKTWLAYAAVSQELERGGRALIIDADHNGGPQIARRLLDLGVPADVLGDLDRFRLLVPEGREQLVMGVDLAVAWAPTIAVVDSIGEVLPMFGGNSNSADDFTVMNRAVLAPLARAGAAVVGIDHLAKGLESRLAGASGTSAKLRAIGGSYIRVTIREPFAPGRGGCAALSIKKDRPGGLRASSPSTKAEAPCGLLLLEQRGDRIVARITEPHPEDAVDVAGTTNDYQPTAEQLAEVDSLPEDDRTVRGVKRALGVGQAKAQAILAAYSQAT